MYQGPNANDMYPINFKLFQQGCLATLLARPCAYVSFSTTGIPQCSQEW